MQEFTRTVAVKAAKIVAVRESDIDPERNRTVELADGSIFDTNLATVTAAPPDALDGGYYVEYPDGHVSIWRAADFEENFKPA